MAIEDWCTHTNVGDVAVIKFTKQEILTASAVSTISQGLKSIVDSEPHDRFVFDFSSVTFLTSAALGMLISLQKHIASKSGQLKLVGLAEELREIFRITRLDQVFDIYRDAEAALNAFGRNE
jgi:anti-sigma B factor antagonist